MVRCANCNTIQVEGAVTCHACGTALAAPPDRPVVAGQEGRTAPPGAPATPGAPIVPGQEGPGRAAAPATAPSSPIVPGQEGPGRSTASPTAPPPTPPAAPAMATQPPLVAGPPPHAAPGPLTTSSPPGTPTLDGPAGVGHLPPGGYVAAPVVVGPPPEPPANKGLKIAALAVSGLVLVVLVALVVVVAMSKNTTTTAGGTEPSTSSTAAPTTTAPSTTVPDSGPVALTVSVGAASVESGQTITLNVGLAGEQREVESTTLAIDGVPGESATGFKNQFTVPSSFPGTFELKVTVKLKDGRTVESSAAPVTVFTTTTTAPPQPQGLQPNGLNTDGVTPLVFGDSVSKAEQITGARATPHCGGNGLSMNGLPSLLLIFGDNRTFTEYFTNDPRYSTPSGGRVGLTVEELRARLPSAVHESGPQDSDVYAVHSGSRVVLFGITSGRVAWIAGGTNGSAGYGC